MRQHLREFNEICRLICFTTSANQNLKEAFKFNYARIDDSVISLKINQSTEQSYNFNFFSTFYNLVAVTISTRSSVILLNSFH